ncbi:MAG: HD-GYP domain-containing protein, partial [Clostridia bacterium]|nr:HD-GYP domain-containing protein [Clostridia bacterium]
ILGRYGEIYLKRNTKLEPKYINRLNSLGYSGIYIEDDISEGIEISEIVDTKIRLDTVNKVKDIYDLININKKKLFSNWQELDYLTSNIISQMSNNKNVAYNMLYIKTYDDYTFSHCVNVALLSTLVGIELHMSRADLIDLFKSALMHDLGKVFLPIDIINKPGILNDYEFAKIKQHPLKGYEFLKEENYLSMKGCRGVLMHHERYDGRGYLLGAMKDEINLYGKILSICDVYDALTSDRTYRKAWSQLEAIEYIMANSGQMFDPEVTKMFLKKIAPYNPGVIVLLSNGFKAIIVRNNEELPLRPVIRIFEENGSRVDSYEVDLKNSNHFLNVTIEKEVEI